MNWLLLLAAVLVPVFLLLVVSAVSALGYEADQGQVKKALRVGGLVVLAYGAGADNWLCMAAGATALLLSHPKVNLPRISHRIDSAVAGRPDHPARYVP